MLKYFSLIVGTLDHTLNANPFFSLIKNLEWKIIKQFQS